MAVILSFVPLNYLYIYKEFFSHAINKQTKKNCNFFFLFYPCWFSHLAKIISYNNLGSLLNCLQMIQLESTGKLLKQAFFRNQLTSTLREKNQIGKENEMHKKEEIGPSGYLQQ